MSEDMKNLTDDKLEHVRADLIERLIKSINDLNQSTSGYSYTLIALTCLLFFVTLLQLFVSLKAISNLWIGWFFLIIFVASGLFYLIWPMGRKKR